MPGEADVARRGDEQPDPVAAGGVSTPEWVEEALTATGTATVRRRRLPAELAVWLVIGTALFRNRAVTEVANKLNLVLPGRRGPTAAPSSIVRLEFLA